MSENSKITEESILAMTAGSEIDALVALNVCGYELLAQMSRKVGRQQLVCREDTFPPNFRVEYNIEPLDISAFDVQQLFENSSPKYSTDLNGCHEMEKTLGKRSLWPQYEAALELTLRRGADFIDPIDFAHADALTRCKAALLSTMGFKFWMK